MVTIHPNDQHLKAQKTGIPGITVTNCRTAYQQGIGGNPVKKESHSTLFLGKNLKLSPNKQGCYIYAQNAGAATLWIDTTRINFKY